ncbi:M48 family metalloprotease [Candidatus Dependentiae bacterium]|nr:M48 family metalloprotease [Candidatus Dependentiae bacterium]
MAYASTRNQSKGLLFAPTGVYKQQFIDEIIRCGLEPKKVLVRYAYTDDAVAMTLFNVIAVDQMVWNTIQDDPEALKAREVVEKHVLPNVPENKKEMHQVIKNNLTPNVQKFIFRHELAHVFYNYSYRRVLITSIIGAAAAGIALAVAFNANPILGGFGTLLISICAGAIADLLFSYATNFFFKSYEEKRADIFATRFSSKEEIEEAANFFEQYEQAARKYRETFGSIMFKLPTTIVNGYIDGMRRAQYLREIARLR